MGQFIDKLNNSIKSGTADYERKLYQTYFTTPEWRNVEMAEELGRFVEQGYAFYRFPFLRQIKDFWVIFGKSYQTARKFHTHREILLSEYMMMNLFIGVFTSVGFVAKGALSLVLAPFLPKENKTLFQARVGTIIQEYSQFLQHTPFYNFPYLEKLAESWQAFKAIPSRSAVDYLTMGLVLVELVTRHTISWPIAWWYNQPQNAAADTIHVLLKSKGKRLDFNQLDKRIHQQAHYLRANENDRGDHYYHVTLPRYKSFESIVRQCVKEQVLIRKIAGQDRLQVKITALPEQSTKGFSVLYQYQNHIDHKRTIAMDVKVNELDQTLREIDKRGLDLKTIHDF